ncbi:MAG TPA: LptA/OstA family protein, partial [Vicinamibacterales bacterium]
ARKKVRGTFLIREEPAPGQKPEPAKPTIATAEELIYDEAQRKATFRQSARMDGPDGNITAERIEIFLKEDGNTLERAEAYGEVKASLGNNRVATGERLTYNAATRIYTMTGKPLTVRQQIEDKGAGGKIRCEKTEGASLTLNRSTDSIKVTGASGAQVRAVPVPCGAKPPIP